MSFDEEQLPWKPFGLTMTHADWDAMVDWYVGTFEERQEYNEEIKTYGLELYTQELATWTD